LGVNPSWEDLHFFDVPFFKDFSTVPMSENTPTTFILYYYSSPNTDVDSGLFSYTNKLKKSTPNGFKNGTQSVYQSTYGISGLEINETNWKIQGYSFVSYDNNPCIGDYTIGLTNSYSGNIIDNDIPNKSPLKYSVFGKGWYYDDVDNEYTWYNKIFNDSRDKHNNPVGGDSGLQETSDGYIENNYIAKYIPFQKFNLSFLYENLRADSGIKIYLSSKLPSSRPLESSKYVGSLYYPINYIRRGPVLTQSWAAGSRYSLVSGVSQIADGGLTLKGGATFSFPNKENIYAPILSYLGIDSNAYSTTIRDYPNAEIVNNILVDDTNTDLKEIKVNLTLRHINFIHLLF
jgi:hypothetical protein